MSADLDPEADAFGGGPTLLESDEEADIRDARPSPRRACSYSQSRTRKICSHTSSSINTYLPWLQVRRGATRCPGVHAASPSFVRCPASHVGRASEQLPSKRTISTGASVGTSGTWERSTPDAAPLPQRRLAAGRNTTPSPWAQTGEHGLLACNPPSARQPVHVPVASDPVAATSGA